MTSRRNPLVDGYLTLGSSTLSVEDWSTYCATHHLPAVIVMPSRTGLAQVMFNLSALNPEPRQAKTIRAAVEKTRLLLAEVQGRYPVRFRDALCGVVDDIPNTDARALAHKLARVTGFAYQPHPIIELHTFRKETPV